MKRFSFLRPVVFKKDNTFVTHDLAKNWLKRLNVSMVGKMYALKGTVFSGENYVAYFDEDGHFLYIKLTVWSKASQIMLSWPKFRIAYTTQYIDKTGAVWNVLRRYEITNVVDNSNISSKARERVLEELQRQDILASDGYHVLLTDKIYMSYLNKDKQATVHKHYDGKYWVRQTGPSGKVLSQMPLEHIMHWIA